MQFKVPQDVLRADKIVGFLTLRQLIIVMIGGGIAYTLYTILSKQYFVEIWLPPVLFITCITIAFAFIRFHDLPFERLVLVFIEYKFTAQKRYWQKMQGDVWVSTFDTSFTKKIVEAVAEPVMTQADRRKKLEEITKVVDTQAHKITQKHV